MPPDTSLYSVAQIRQIETAAAAPLPPGALMQRAGKAAADAAIALLGHPGAPVLALAGPGNNGGDALEAAAHLERAGYETVVILRGDPERYSPEARDAWRKASAAGAQIESGDLQLEQHPWCLVIDGLFGIGLARAIDGELAKLVEAINQLPCPILALDVPSGLDADTGRIVGAGAAVRASHTLTFIGDKPGLHTGHGRDCAGRVSVASLEIDAAIYPSPVARLNSPALFAHGLKPRLQNSHKGSYGDVALLGGAAGMQGAILLAGRASAMCGAGRVFAGFLDAPPGFDPLRPELMCRDAAMLELERRTLVVGPGLGSSDAARALLERAVDGAGPLLLDADGLNLLAGDARLQERLRARAAPTVFTPHPLEAARLLQCSSSEVQENRLQAAADLARRFHAVAVLKGSGSVIAAPDGRMAINPNGNPGLATAGSGDVLSGIGGALLAQGWEAWDTALGAVWLHGRAADLLAERGIGPIGMVAGELIDPARSILNQLVAQQASG